MSPARRSPALAWTLVVMLTLLVAGLGVAGYWAYNERAWLMGFPKDHWVVAVRVDGNPSLLDVYETGRTMSMKAAIKLNHTHSGQLDWAYGTAGGGQSWPEYGASRMLFSAGNGGILPDPEQFLQECVRALQELSPDPLNHVHGTWRIAVHDDRGRLAGPVSVRYPEARE